MSFHDLAVLNDTSFGDSRTTGPVSKSAAGPGLKKFYSELRGCGEGQQYRISRAAQEFCTAYVHYCSNRRMVSLKRRGLLVADLNQMICIEVKGQQFTLLQAASHGPGILASGSRTTLRTAASKRTMINCRCKKNLLACLRIPL